MKVYEFPSGLRLTVIDGEGLGDDPDAPIPYLPTVMEYADVSALSGRVADLERRLTQAHDLKGVWQEVAQQLQQRCERAFDEIATLSGRTRAAVRAEYVPETQGGTQDRA